jgi:hypothetical protein
LLVLPGEALPRYDKLEFKLIGGCIVCEGVVVDSPKSRRRVEKIGDGFSRGHDTQPATNVAMCSK